MSAPVLCRIRRSAAQAIDDTLSEQWAAHRLADLAREAEEAVAECLDYPDSARAHWRRTFQAAADAVQRREAVDWQQVGDNLRDLFDGSLEVLLTLRKWVGRAEGAGERVANAALLDQAIAAMERLKAEVFDHWPWPPTPEEVAEAVADYERGDSLPLDEAFAEIAGVSKEAWLARVAERRRQLQEEGKDTP